MTVSRTINVWQPAHTFKYIKGFVAIVAPNGVDAIGAAGDNVKSTTGIEWNGTVTTPLLFRGPGSNGSLNYTQLITPHYSRTVNGVLHSYPLNNLQGLDGMFPYAGHTFVADGSVGSTGDGPYLVLDVNMMKASRGDLKLEAQTWMLYQPPSYQGTAPTTFVPLHELDWTVDGYATYDPITMKYTATATDPANLSGITVTYIRPTSVLPKWTRLIYRIDY